MRRFVTAATVALLVIGCPSVHATSAVALDAANSAKAAGTVAGRMTLSGQPAWSAIGDDIPFRLAISATQPDLEVHAQVHDAVLSRIAFERTLNGDRLGSVRASRSVAVAALAVVGSDRVFTLGLQDPAAPREPSRVSLRIPGDGRAGVFPVEFELRDGTTGDVIDSFVTDIVTVRRDATASETPALQVAWLWHLAASPATSPSGAVSTSFSHALAPGGRLGRLATGLGQADDVPITLVPNPETIDALRTLGAENSRASVILGAIRTAGETSTVLASPYTTLDGPALLQAGLGSALSDQITLGRATLETTLEAAVDSTLAAPQPLNAVTLDRLKAVGGTTRFVVAPSALEPAPGPDQFTPSRPFKMTTPAGVFDAVEVNTTATRLLTRGGSGALRAQQILAGLSVIALEQPSRVRGVVIDTPLLWNAEPTRVAAILAGLRAHPLLSGAPLADLFGIPPATINDEAYTRTLAVLPARSAPITPRQFATARRQVDGLASMVGGTDPRVTQLRHEINLLVASGVPGTGSLQSDQRLRTISDQVGSVTSGVSAPIRRTVQLTSRKASVPLSIENSTAQVVRVRVTLTSQKLDFPDGSSREIELSPGKNTTATFDVEARASGTFPMLVTLSSANGVLDIQRSRYTVRSSAVSGVGLILTIGAGLFLAIWWLTHWRRSRRPSTTEPAP